MKAVDEFEPERNQQGDEQQKIGQIRGDAGAGGIDVGIDAVDDKQERSRYHPHVDDALQRIDAAVEVRPLFDRRLDRAG